MGKGSRPRPVNKARYDENYDRIFRQPPPAEEVPPLVTEFPMPGGASLPVMTTDVVPPGAIYTTEFPPC